MSTDLDKLTPLGEAIAVTNARNRVKYPVKDVFAGSPFKSTAEYHNFAMEHKVFGADALALKRKLDKQDHELEPKISPRRKK